MHDLTLWNTERLQAEAGLLAVALGDLHADHTQGDLLLQPEPAPGQADAAELLRKAGLLTNLGLATLRLLHDDVLSEKSQVSLTIGKSRKSIDDDDDTPRLTAVCVIHGDTAVVAVHQTGDGVAKGLLRLIKRCAPKPRTVPPTATLDQLAPSSPIATATPNPETDR